MPSARKRMQNGEHRPSGYAGVRPLAFPITTFAVAVRYVRNTEDPMRAIGGEGRYPWSAEHFKEKADASILGSPQAAIDYNSSIIGALELSEKKWVLAVQLPGVDRHSEGQVRIGRPEVA